jgi:hypothetical protein
MNCLLLSLHTKYCRSYGESCRLFEREPVVTVIAMASPYRTPKMNNEGREGRNLP